MPVPSNPPATTTPAAFKTWSQDVVDTVTDHETRIAAVETDKADDADVVHDTGAETIAGVKTFSSDPLIPDEAYGVGWNGSLEPPTKNAVYDKIETLGGGGGSTAGIVQQAVTLDYTITTSIADVTGATITVPTAGVYRATFDADCDIATGDTFAEIRLNVNGSDNASKLWGKRTGAHAATSTVSKTWKITTSGASEVVKVRAIKVGAGTSKIMAVHSVLTIEGPLATTLP